MEKDSEVNIEEHLDVEIQKLKRTLRGMSDNLKELANKDPVVLIEDVFNLCLNYFERRKHSRLISLFQMILDNAGSRKSFLIALYQGVYGVQKMMEEQKHAPVFSPATSQNLMLYKSKSQQYNFQFSLL